MKEKTTFTGLRELLIPGIMQYMTTVMLGFLVIHAGFLILFLNQKLTIMVVAGNIEPNILCTSSL